MHKMSSVNVVYAKTEPGSRFVELDGEELLTFSCAVMEFYTKYMQIEKPQGGLYSKIFDALDSYNKTNKVVNTYPNGTICTHVDKTAKINIEFSPVEIDLSRAAFKFFKTTVLESSWIHAQIADILSRFETKEIIFDEDIDAICPLCENFTHAKITAEKIIISCSNPECKLHHVFENSEKISPDQDDFNIRINKFAECSSLLQQKVFVITVEQALIVQGVFADLYNEKYDCYHDISLLTDEQTKVWEEFDKFLGADDAEDF